MRIAVACDGDRISPHFGRCERFLIAEIEGEQVQVSEWMANPGHEPGLLPRLMVERKVECVLAGGAGPRAIGMFDATAMRCAPDSCRFMDYRYWRNPLIDACFSTPARIR
jgi:predicted Fe-Mo cluster-binding NifX family protein